MGNQQLQERILLCGVPGAGKTYAWLTLSRFFPNNTFYVIDLEFSFKSYINQVKNMKFKYWLNEQTKTGSISFKNYKSSTILKLDLSFNCCALVNFPKRFSSR